MRRTRSRNSAASGQLAAKARRTLVAVSRTRTATFSNRLVLDPLTQIDAAPTHHTVFLQIGAYFDPGVDLGLLLSC